MSRRVSKSPKNDSSNGLKCTLGPAGADEFAWTERCADSIRKPADKAQPFPGMVKRIPGNGCALSLGLRRQTCCQRSVAGPCIALVHRHLERLAIADHHDQLLATRQGRVE